MSLSISYRRPAGTTTFFVPSDILGGSSLVVSVNGTPTAAYTISGNNVVLDSGLGGTSTVVISCSSLAMSGPLVSSLSAATGPVVNVSGNVTAVGSGAEIILSAKSGLLVVNDHTSESIAAFVAAGGTVTKLGGPSNIVVSSTPTTSDIGVYYHSGSQTYRIKNGFVVSHNIAVLWIATRNAV